MDGIIIIAVIWLIISALTKGLKNAAGSGSKSRSQPPAPPGGAPARPRTGAGRPLTPVARPGSGMPDWPEIMTMLGSAPASQQNDARDMEGVSTEAQAPSGSLTGPNMMEGSPGMMEGSPGMMEGSADMMAGSPPDYEGATMPGELSADAVASLPSSNETAPPLRAIIPVKRFNSAAMRDAVIWSEILARPKALRRVAR